MHMHLTDHFEKYRLNNAMSDEFDQEQSSTRLHQQFANYALSS